MSKYHTSDFKLTSKLGKSLKKTPNKQSFSSKDVLSNSDMKSLESLNFLYNNSDSDRTISYDSSLDEKNSSFSESTCSDDSFHPIVALDIDLYNRSIINNDEYSMFNLIFTGLNDINLDNVYKPRQFNA